MPSCQSHATRPRTAPMPEGRSIAGECQSQAPSPAHRPHRRYGQQAVIVLPRPVDRPSQVYPQHQAEQHKGHAQSGRDDHRSRAIGLGDDGGWRNELRGGGSHCGGAAKPARSGDQDHALAPCHVRCPRTRRGALKKQEDPSIRRNSRAEGLQPPATPQRSIGAKRRYGRLHERLTPPMRSLRCHHGGGTGWRIGVGGEAL